MRWGCETDMNWRDLSTHSGSRCKGFTCKSFFFDVLKDNIPSLVTDVAYRRSPRDTGGNGHR